MAPHDPPHGKYPLPDGVEYEGNGVYRYLGEEKPHFSLDGYQFYGAPYHLAANFWAVAIAARPGYEPWVGVDRKVGDSAETL